MGGIAPTILTFQDVCRLSGGGVPFDWGVYRSGLLIRWLVMGGIAPTIQRNTSWM